MDNRKIVFKETAVILIGQIICVAIMFGIYALMSKFTTKVLLGGIVGCVMATANFFFMAVGAGIAADKAEKDDVKGGKSTIRLSYTLRLVVLALVLFACAKSGYFDLLALVLPIVLVRPILTIHEFFRKGR